MWADGGMESHYRYAGTIATTKCQGEGEKSPRLSCALIGAEVRLTVGEREGSG